MLKSIIGVWIKGKLRDVDFYRNIGAVGALVLMAILYIGMNENLLFLLIGFLKSVSPRYPLFSFPLLYHRLL
jgi:hypothetical protein